MYIYMYGQCVLKLMKELKEFHSLKSLSNRHTCMLYNIFNNNIFNNKFVIFIKKLEFLFLKCEFFSNIHISYRVSN